MAAPLRAAADLEEHHGTLPDLDAIDGIVSFGGEASAWEPHNAPEAELIRAAVERELPYLGVCLGAQLLAHALGGTVSRLDRRMIAWTPLTVIAGDPVLGA
ncbi:MAG TPA: gamma-glutamyl-gamma-aminobutyrate hydrolase family protein, partial [Solirubrobacter sp.]|nr:gamma-glutamyl-gamma-aminobutyrate hydrolase family protein [Solirubrobacter sp.]